MIAADDPRHGTAAGYLAHRRADEDACEPCSIGRRRQAKGFQLEHLAGTRMMYTRAEMGAVLEPWLALGLAPGAVAVAAGMEWQRGSDFARETGPVRRNTYLAVAAVTESDLEPSSLVWADLTRTRIYSLMAAGHLQSDMPINPRGTWRNHRKISVALASAIRGHYELHQYARGQSANTASRALSAGHVPPAAWDDPGTLAWPLGWTSPLVDPVRFDEVNVLRLLAGDWSVRCTKEERIEVTARWRASGRSLYELEKATGWKVQRYYTPDRQQVAS